MRTTYLKIILVLIMIPAGCSIVIEPRDDGSGQARRHVDTATLTEIDAAADLTFDNAKEKAFAGIASRPYLSADAQVYLVKKAMRSLTFDDAKRDVLLALVKNPYFTAEGKQAVLENLDALTFDSGKQKVLEAINRRGYVPSERDLQRQLERQRLDKESEAASDDGMVKIQTQVGMRATYMTEL